MAVVNLHGIQTILLDIEGTICPITFVKDVMYPSALSTLQDLLGISSSSGSSPPNSSSITTTSTSSTPFPPPALAPYLQSFPADAQSSGPAFVAHIAHLTATDSKAAPLKALQGFLWRSGFASGRLRAPLFADVPAQLKAWNSEKNHRLAIFSSGSVEAQKLFLAHTGVVGGADGPAGKREVGVDLTSLFEGHFDTVNAGPKGEKESYEKIANALDAKTSTVLFLSDSVTEVRAAKAAGMQSLVVDRPGNAPLTDQDRAELTVITNFDEIVLE